MNSVDNPQSASHQASKDTPMSTRFNDKHSKSHRKPLTSKPRNENLNGNFHHYRQQGGSQQSFHHKSNGTRLLDRQFEGLRLAAAVPPPVPHGINPLPLVTPVNHNSMAAALAAASYSSSSAPLATSTSFVPAASFCAATPLPPSAHFAPAHSSLAQPASPFAGHLVLAQAAARVINPIHVKNLLSQSIALQQHLHRMVGPINFTGHNYHPVEQPSPSSPSVDHSHGSTFSSPSSASSTSSSPSPSASSTKVTGRHMVSSRLFNSRSLGLLSRRSASQHRPSPCVNGPCVRAALRKERHQNGVLTRIRDSVSCPSLLSPRRTSEDDLSSDSCLSNYDDLDDLRFSSSSTPTRIGDQEDRVYARETASTPLVHPRASCVSDWESIESLSSETSDFFDAQTSRENMKRHHEQIPNGNYGSSSRSNNQSNGGKRNRNLSSNHSNRGASSHLKAPANRGSNESGRQSAKSEQDENEKERVSPVNGPTRTGSGTGIGAISSMSPSGGSVALVTPHPTERLQEEIGLTSPDDVKCLRHLGSGDAPTRIEKKNPSVRSPSSPPRPQSSPPGLTTCPYTLPGQISGGSAYEIRQHKVTGSTYGQSTDSSRSTTCGTTLPRTATPPVSAAALSPSQRLQLMQHSQLLHVDGTKTIGLTSGSSLAARTGSALSQQNSPLLQQQRHLSDDSASKKTSGMVSGSSSGCSSIATSPSPPFMLIDPYPEITNKMVKFYDSNVQTNDLFTKKMQLRQAIYQIIKDVFPYCGLYVVGSSMNGFGGVKSDMDMCLMICQQEIDQHREAPEILRMIYRGLKKCAYIIDLELIRAKVPILKFRDKISGVECDLNVNNSVGIRNTHLLSFYSKADWRVRPLVMTVKHWAKRQQIGDASRKTISSYSLELMTIHFLQAGCSPPVLPCLQKEFPRMFDPNCDIRSLSLNDELPAPFSSKNTQFLGELFINFLEYYSETFNFDRDAISVRMGRAVQKEVVQYYSSPKNSPHMWKSLCIEEPFDHTNTARSVYDMGIFEQIKHVFQRSRDELLKTGDLESILQAPYVPFEEQIQPPY